MTVGMWIVVAALLVFVGILAAVIWDYERVDKRVTALEQHIAPEHSTGRHTPRETA